MARQTPVHMTKRRRASRPPRIPIAEIERLCKQYEVRELALFGSVVRSDFKTHSDVDLLVEFKPDAPIGYLALLRMQRELSAIFHRPVDLVPKSGLKDRIRASVLASAEVIYAA